MTRSFFTIDEETNEDRTVISNSNISQSVTGLKDVLELGQSGYFGCTQERLNTNKSTSSEETKNDQFTFFEENNNIKLDKSLKFKSSQK